MAEVTLTTEQLAKHRHYENNNFAEGIRPIGYPSAVSGETTAGGGTAGSLNSPKVLKGNQTATATYAVLTGPEGGDKPHNNMPPYVTAYCWRRIA